jgi:hypothetical protein
LPSLGGSSLGSFESQFPSQDGKSVELAARKPRARVFLDLSWRLITVSTSCAES